ncbi:MAG TPA: radical SAM protein [Thermoanaerobaculia bacterium]|nr:radical SAM protein [Thermoanaerobaculia bacterium]HUM29647.1 radical SAM protein [Thermoanaerobaculia bacterium]HXK67298.1 radical SAM protein [Thermoanaerobaculia bacterium]
MIFRKKQPLSKGLYHQRIEEPEMTARLHLRVEEGGRGVLSINAAKILHLNPTATEIVKLSMDGLDRSEILRTMKSRYRASKRVLETDIARVLDTVSVLVRTDGICPITYLDTEPVAAFSYEGSAPLRMDLALTYRCSNDCHHCYNLKGRAEKELEKEEWYNVLQRLWNAGIPHVAFTGGEPTLRDDLPDLIARAEEIGLVTGLLTHGRRLADRDYLQALGDAGLDYVQITLESADPEIHDRMVGAHGAHAQTLQGIRNCIDAGLYVLTNTTLTRTNAGNAVQTVRLIADLGLPSFAVNGMIHTGKEEQKELALSMEELTRVLTDIREEAERLGLRFIWYTPTRYCELNPVDLQLGLKQCSAARISMAIEPDGTVLPCQSTYTSVGNILNDSWTSIWNHPVCISLRERRYMMEACTDCEWVDLCGGGCPLETDHGDYTCMASPTGS